MELGFSSEITPATETPNITSPKSIVSVGARKTSGTISSCRSGSVLCSVTSASASQQHNLAQDALQRLFHTADDRDPIGTTPCSPRRVTENSRPDSLVQKPSMIRNTVALPPRWMNFPSCSIFARKFGTFKKRHPCCNCGQSICRDNSACERMKLPHYGLSDRNCACVVCHDMLRNASRHGR
ncbi:hypothetical protein PF010_g24981 [Phytophthora fragariae]|uniref:FYVE-type domain-containing protein n=2 Tax=Phytophthora TaxID=4783 RepID=A0A6A3Y516_9STRA|nr:hypothetical protein PF009_g13791 [Phytophthora fragariae]KAE8975514.1 hypothetical protein PR001_g25678 [Phytophthora rubi]KAE9020101.1 hypothetical protein PR002_g12615 [Phytophthora rubi]KAE9073668.1 hypothetical protein PF010_g24981 [Phytophthora fragariae]KAE9089747.1 hypothetical protein PF006_g25290 [Phytophthora fragariae]